MEYSENSEYKKVSENFAKIIDIMMGVIYYKDKQRDRRFHRCDGFFKADGGGSAVQRRKVIPPEVFEFNRD